MAYQLILSAHKFTFGHDTFRLYLTDISPDNIVINKNLSINFIDLENAVILRKTEKVLKLHPSYHFEEKTYIFSEDELCSHDLSDHNIYSVCWLILSKNAPWPMMTGGLLHSPPKNIISNYSTVFDNIEECVKSTQLRFNISDKIKSELKLILLQKKTDKYNLK